MQPGGSPVWSNTKKNTHTDRRAGLSHEQPEQSHVLLDREKRKQKMLMLCVNEWFIASVKKLSPRLKWTPLWATLLATPGYHSAPGRRTCS